MDEILITELNDFIFCPVSIYFHKLYGYQNKVSYQSKSQLLGTAAHKSIDEGFYTAKKNVLMGTDVYCEKYRLIGKIDMYDGTTKTLIERKRHIKKVYDGYIFQLFAQLFSLREMGYEVRSLYLYSMVDNKKYKIQLPEIDNEMLLKFEKTVKEIREFDMEAFVQENVEKCNNCIYADACDRQGGMEC